MLVEGEVGVRPTYEQELSSQAGRRSAGGLSRQHLVDLLDTSEIAHHRVGAHRRVRLEDVLAFAEASPSTTLGELAHRSHESDPVGYH